jgi:hypothetical protein
MTLPLLITIVSALLVGYIWGKHDRGLYKKQQWIVRIPLLLRQQSLEKGYCVLCNESKKKRFIYKLGQQRDKQF